MTGIEETLEIYEGVVRKSTDGSLVLQVNKHIDGLPARFRIEQGLYKEGDKVAVKFVRYE